MEEYMRQLLVNTAAFVSPACSAMWNNPNNTILFHEHTNHIETTHEIKVTDFVTYLSLLVPISDLHWYLRLPHHILFQPPTHTHTK